MHQPRSREARKGALGGTALIVVASALLVLAWGPRPAVADVSQARVLYEKGRAYFQIGEYQKALEAFKAAHVEKADPAFLYNIAECHRQLGDSANALAFYQRFLRLAPDSPLRAEAQARIAELEAAKPRSPASAQAPPATGAPTTPAPVSPLPPAAQAPPGAGAPATPAPVSPTAGGSGTAGATPISPGGSSSAPAVTLVQTRPAESGEARPVYRKAWFWVVVGAVLLGGAVTVWAVTRSGDGTDIPTTTLGNENIFGAAP